jgi:uncharacterized membrane protein
MGQMTDLARSTPLTAGRKAAGQTNSRFWEIDALRGLAVITMMIYHLLWDLWFLGVLPDIVLWDGFWMYFQRATAATFILLAGTSMAILTQRTPAHEDKPLVRRLAARGIKILGLGLLITLAIRLSGLGRLDFGILHLLGLSMLLALPFRRQTWLNLVFWLVFFVAGSLVQSVDAKTLWLVPLGLAPAGYAPLDYFPLIPWFGVLLLGMGLANLLYARTGRRFPLPDLSSSPLIRGLRPLGRHSLVLYLVHQPLLWGLLALLGFVQR